ncbi:MAG: hypothetical protein QOG14_3940 [Mycobacterium sp.]|jgi:hypothetical protein|nr:hypothetical protein [Mycobacterium sp.]
MAGPEMVCQPGTVKLAAQRLSAEKERLRIFEGV